MFAAHLFIIMKKRKPIITIYGHEITINKRLKEIYVLNHSNITDEDVLYKLSNKIGTYLVDEAFITKSKHKIIIVNL